MTGVQTCALPIFDQIHAERDGVAKRLERVRRRVRATTRVSDDDFHGHDAPFLFQALMPPTVRQFFPPSYCTLIAAANAIIAML